MSWSQPVTSRPSNATTVSPGLKPAAAAGVGVHVAGSGVSSLPSTTMHAETFASWRVGCGVPKPMSVTAMNSTPSTMFMAGPPSMTTTFFQTGSW